MLSATEEWLYTEEGEDATKSVYVGKLEELEKFGKPITHRFREADERPSTVETFRRKVQELLTAATSGVSVQHICSLHMFYKSFSFLGCQI
jgi:heat shock protein 4